MPTKPPSNLRYSKQDTFDLATECVSDLEDCQRELDHLAKSAHVDAIGRILKASQMIEDAVELLMHIDNTDD